MRLTGAWIARDGSKIALLLGSSSYADVRLSQLKGPPLDVVGLAEVLRDTGIGGFNRVHALVNEPLDAVRRSIFDLFDRREREDLVLLYFSGHGVRDLHGRLFFAVNDTELDKLPITALAANEVRERMDESRSRRQVLILDSCYSGAFYRGARQAGQLALTRDTFDVRGYGREVLTSASATQYSFEGDQLVKGEPPSGLGTFTHYLVEGLRTGAAAPGSDHISAAALFDYASRQVKSANANMTPERWSDFRDDQPLIIARNPGPRASLALSYEGRRANLLARLEEIGLANAPSDEQVSALLATLKDREAKGYAYEGAAASFELLARRALGQIPDYFRLISFRVIDERRFNARNELVTLSEATVKVEVGGTQWMIVEEGNGPVNALDRALRHALCATFPVLEHIWVVDYKVRILTPDAGTVAVTRVIIESVDDEGRRWSTVGVSSNVIDASYAALHDGITYKLLVDGAVAA